MLEEMDVVDAFGCGSAALDALVAVAERDEARREDAATLPFLQRFVLAVSQESRKESVDGRRYEALKGVGTLAAADEWLGGRHVTRPEEETPGPCDGEYHATAAGVGSRGSASASRSSQCRLCGVEVPPRAGGSSLVSRREACSDRRE